MCFKTLAMKRFYIVYFVVLLFGSIVSGQPKQLWGMTSHGGEYGGGTIFKTDENGNNHTVVYSFDVETPGSKPKHTKLCEAPNGKLYGMTTGGGQFNRGVIFEYNPIDGSYEKKIDLDISTGGNPEGSLIKTTDGKFFGMTASGGENNCGVIFEYDPESNVYVKKVDLYSGVGAFPKGSLFEASNGKLYGMTFRGGRNNDGTIIEYDPVNNAINKIFDFSYDNGRWPMGDLVESEAGQLYGMTWRGGEYDEGVLFQIDCNTGVYNKINDFNGTNGSLPQGSLVFSGDIIYGTTLVGGIYGRGVLFKYDPQTATYSKLIDFTRFDGTQPIGTLLEAENGKLYGLTTYGGNHSHGSIYEYDKARNVFTTRISFDLSTGGGLPYGSLTEASNGKLYGVTYSGGANEDGSLFEFDIYSNAFSTKVSFNKSGSGNHPWGSLVYASNGKFYGLTNSGGNHGGGTLFEYDPEENIYTKKYDFGSWLNSSHRGCNPFGSLVELSDDGILYGMTSRGGSAVNGKGMIFKYNVHTSVLEKIVDINFEEGGQPLGDLVKASNGKLYGMTNDGGISSKGVLFEFDPIANIYTKKIDFTGSNGAHPKGSLVRISNGELVGTTHDGGDNGEGVIFKYNPVTDVFNKLFDFSTTTGRWMHGNLVEADNGILFGMTRIGGLHGNGVIFKFELSNKSYSEVYQFGEGDSGRNPLGSLMKSSNGKLYGLTTSGGDNMNGVLIEFDPATSGINAKTDFLGINGANRGYSNIIEITEAVPTDVAISVKTDIEVFPNPTSGIVNIRKKVAGEVYYRIFDINGKDLFSGKLTQTLTEINLSNCSSGVYTILFASEQKIDPVKIIKY